MSIKPIFEFQTMGGVFLGVKNNSKNFENKKNIGLFSKILSKWTLFYSKFRMSVCYQNQLLDGWMDV